jgi:hypothetical protein
MKSYGCDCTPRDPGSRRPAQGGTRTRTQRPTPLTRERFLLPRRGQPPRSQLPRRISSRSHLPMEADDKKPDMSSRRPITSLNSMEHRGSSEGRSSPTHLQWDRSRPPRHILHPADVRHRAVICTHVDPRREGSDREQDAANDCPRAAIALPPRVRPCKLRLDGVVRHDDRLPAVPGWDLAVTPGDSPVAIVQPQGSSDWLRGEVIRVRLLHAIRELAASATLGELTRRTLAPSRCSRGCSPTIGAAQGDRKRRRRGVSV